MNNYKCDCGSFTFSVKTPNDCDACDHNGAYDPSIDEYVYNEKDVELAGLERDQVTEQGECSLGTSYDRGCYIITCNSCKTIIHIPLIVE